MKYFRVYIKKNLNVALSIPAILCAIQFIMSLYGVIKTGVFDMGTMNQLLSTADGFESVVLFIIMIALRKKNK